MPELHEHNIHRATTLRAAVLGANDGIISIAGLILGVAASGVGHQELIISAIAGLVAGALSMAAGEFVSVASQADLEKADIRKEIKSLEERPQFEFDELVEIYTSRGLSPDLAREVASQLTAHDALGSHLRDELGLQDVTQARPLRAAIASGVAFTCGALLPSSLIWLSPSQYLQQSIWLGTVVSLMVMGSLAAYVGGASIVKGAARVSILGLFAMGTSSLIGQWVGAVL